MYVATGESIPPDTRDTSLAMISPPVTGFICPAGTFTLQGKLTGKTASGYIISDQQLVPVVGQTGEFTIVNYCIMSPLSNI
jgi:hypothetical protein